MEISKSYAIVVCQRVHLILCENTKCIRKISFWWLIQQHKNLMLCFLLIVLCLRTFKSLSICIWSLNACFKYTLSLKSAINSGHWLGFLSKVISSIGGNSRDSNSWWSAFITVKFARLLMGSTVSSPGTSF